MTYYYDEQILSNWELDEFKNKKRLSLFKWLTIFPEMVGWHKQKLEQLTQKLKNALVRNYELFDNTSWRGALLRITYLDRYGSQIEIISKALQRIYWRNHPEKVIPGQITDSMIQKAREYNTQSLANQDLDKVMRRGDKLVGLCPLHAEKTASFVVFSDNGFKCFGCQVAGSSAIDYMIKIRKLNFKEAVKQLN